MRFDRSSAVGIFAALAVACMPGRPGEVSVEATDTVWTHVALTDTIRTSVAIYDTTRVPVSVPDTTRVPITVYDTTRVRVSVPDTSRIPVTVHDTTRISVVVYDTTHKPVTVLDTTLVPRVDTVVSPALRDSLQARQDSVAALLRAMPTPIEPPAPVMVPINATSSLRIEQEPAAVYYWGDARITLVQTGAGSLAWQPTTSANKDSALRWADIVDSISAIAKPDSMRTRASGQDTLIHVPAGGAIHYNSDVLLYQRADLGKGAGVQNYLSIGVGPPRYPYDVPVYGGAYYGTPVFGPIAVPRETLLGLTDAIRRAATTPHGSVPFPPPPALTP